MPLRPDISVVTLTWNNAADVDVMLRSLFADAKRSGLRAEVLAIDNGSTDATPALLRRHAARFAQLKPLILGSNLGTTVSRNIGIRLARAEHVLLLDSDTRIPPGELARLLTSFERIPTPRERIGLIHPRLTYPDGTFQESARRFPTLLTKLYRLTRWEDARVRDESIDAVLAGQVTPVDYAISAAWLVPRRVFADIGLLDERIFYSPEDVEFCARCWRHGYEVWYDPGVAIVHDCQRLTARKPLSRLGLSHVQGLLRLWRSYGFFPTRTSIAPRSPPRSAAAATPTAPDSAALQATAR